MSIKWGEAGHFVLEHWPLIAVGVVALVGGYYVLGSGSSSAAAASTVDPNAAQELSDATQEQLAQIGGQVQLNLAQIQSDAQLQGEGIQSSSSAFQQLTNAQVSVAQTALATGAQQNIQISNALETGFANYVTASAAETAAAASAAAGIAGSNDMTAGNTIGKTLQGISSVIGSYYTGGLSNLLNSGGSSSNQTVGSSDGSNVPAGIPITQANAPIWV